MSTAQSIDTGGWSDEVYNFFADTFPVFTKKSLEERKNNALLDAVSYAIGKDSDIVEEILKIQKKTQGAAFLDKYFEYGRTTHPFGLPKGFKETYLKPVSITVSNAKEVISTHFNLPIETIEIVSDYFISSDYSTYGEAADYYASVFLEFNIGYNSYDLTVDPIKAKTVLGINWGVSDTYLLASTVRCIKVENYVLPGSILAQKKLTFEVNNPIYGVTTVIHLTVIPTIISALHAITFKLTDVSSYLGRSEFTFVYPYSETYRDYSYSQFSDITTTFVQTPINDIYPFLPIKVLGKPVDKNFSDVLYNGATFYSYTRKLAQTINLDLGFLNDGLKEGNQYYGGTHTSYMYLGANLNSDNNAELAYIFDFFLGRNFSKENMSLTKNWAPAESILGSNGFGNLGYAFSFKVEEAGDSLNLLGETYRRIFSTYVKSIVYSGNMNDYPIEDDRPSVSTPWDDLLVRETLREIPAKGTQNAFRIGVMNILMPSPIGGAPGSTLYYVLDRQISENVWVRLMLARPTVEVYGGKDDSSSVYIITDFFQEWAEGEDGNELRIPIQRSLLYDYTLEEQEDIALRAMGIHIAYKDRESVSVYKGSNFINFMQGITSILSIFTFGASSPLVAAVMMVVAALLPMLIKVIFKILEPLVGKDVAAILTAVIIVVAMAYGFKMDTTQIVLNALNMTSSVSDFYSQFTMEEIEDLQKEGAFFNTRAEDLLEEIEMIMDGLKPGELSPFALGLLSKKDDIVYESPSEFFFRTIHAGNPGARTLNYTARYHERALQLPDGIDEEYT